MADITAKIKLEGEAQFKKQMNSAKAATSTFNSELKLAETRFKNTGDAEKLMADKSAILENKLKSQKASVETAKKALQQCKQQGLDPNSSAVLAWKKRLADAETQVEETTREIANNKKGLDSAGKAYTSAGTKVTKFSNKLDTADDNAEELNTSLSNIDKNVSWQNVASAVQSISTALDNGIKKAVQFGKALWSMTADSTEWADDLATKSAQTGLDTTTLQQWEYAARFVDTDVDAIIAARTKLVKNMGKGGDFDTALEQMGVAVTDAEGKTRDYTDVLWDVLEAMGTMDDTQRESAAMDIFGKSYADLIPLIKAGRKEWDKYAKQAPVVSPENLEKLTKANDALQDLEANLDITKKTLLAQLAPALTEVSNALTGALQELNNYLQTEEGQAKMQAFSDAVTKLAKNLFDIDWSKAIDTAGKAFTAITDALGWIADNKDVVIAALVAINGVKLWNTIATAASNIGKLKTGLNGLLGGGKGGTPTPAPTPSVPPSGAAPAGTGTGVAAGGKMTAAGFLSAFGTAIADAAGLSTTGLTALGASGFGFAAGISAVLSLGMAAVSQNKTLNQGEDANRYKDDPKLKVIEDAAFIMARGTGGADRTYDAMTYLAREVGDVSEWLQVFDYNNGSSNYLVDLLNGTNWQNGDDQPLMAALYRVFADVFGEAGTERGEAALSALPKDVQDAIRYGGIVEQQRKSAGSEIDNASLSTYMWAFFRKHGINPTDIAQSRTGDTEAARAAREAAAHGATTATWAEAEAVIARANLLKRSTEWADVDMINPARAMTLTRPQRSEGGGGSGASLDGVAGMLVSALSGVKVEMDGHTVGVLVAPDVLNVLARQTTSR